VVTFNLRKGFNSLTPASSAVAFSFLGHVGFTFSPGDPVTDFTFGWVQFMRQIALRFVYAGPDDAQGQVVLDPMSRIGTAFLIDRDPAAAAFSPFARDPRLSRFEPTASEAQSTLADHPMVSVRDRVTNTATGAVNFLFSLIDHREAVSVFVVRDKFGNFVPLANLTWDLFYQGTFKWRDRHILTVSDNSSFSPGNVIKGAPTDRRITTLMSKLSPSIAPIFNVVSQNAVQAAALPPPPANPLRQELDHWVDPIPALFFLEGRGSVDIP
jgi:hypothetical protein